MIDFCAFIYSPSYPQTKPNGEARATPCYGVFKSQCRGDSDHELLPLEISKAESSGNFCDTELEVMPIDDCMG